MTMKPSRPCLLYTSKDIATLEERLLTRFEWGLTADVQPPDFETRIAIIRRKAELLELDVPENVAEYIANRLKNNIRQLEGAVKKMKAYLLLNGEAPSISTAQAAIADIINNNQPIPLTVEKIIDEVARTYGTSVEDIRSSKRAANISNARQVAVYVVREITQMPMEMCIRDRASAVSIWQAVFHQILHLAAEQGNRAFRRFQLLLDPGTLHRCKGSSHF